jgi:hypothetical protein
VLIETIAIALHHLELWRDDLDSQDLHPGTRPGHRGRDGNAVLIKGRTALWSTATNKKGSVLVMQKDGNLVVIHGRTKIWATNTAGR